MYVVKKSKNPCKTGKFPIGKKKRCIRPKTRKQKRSSKSSSTSASSTPIMNEFQKMRLKIAKMTSSQ